MSNQPQQTPEETPGPIVARAGTYYRNARYIMFAIIVAMGVWFLYDGFVKYPNENRKYAELTAKIDELNRNPETRDGAEHLRYITARKEVTQHDTFSITLQKILGFSLPPLAIGLLVYWLYKSRGVIQMNNGVLSAPGHPDVPLANVDELDKGLWEKKGIAYVYYTLPNNATGKLRLDDFIYQARPIRDMVKQIETELKSQDQIIARAKALKDQQASTAG